MLCPKQSWSNPTSEGFCIFACKRFIVVALALSPNLCWVDSSPPCPLLFNSYPVVPATLVEKFILIFFLCSIALEFFLKINWPQVFISLCGHCPFLLTYMSIHTSVSCCLDYSSFMGSLKSGNLHPPILFSFKIVLALLGPLKCHLKSISNLLITTEFLVEFWMKLFWIYRWSWKELIY